MAIQLSTAERNARLDQFETTAGATAKLQIRTGAQPSDCAAADSGTLLAELTLPSDYMAAASGGTKALTGTWTGTAVATGTPGHFRLKDNAGTTTHMQGSCGVGSGDLSFDGTITSGQTVTVTAFTLTEGNP